MASRRKKTNVSHRNLADIPSIPLRILAFLISRRAYCSDDAVKVSVIARDLAIEVDEAVFVCKELAAPGFAVVDQCEITERAPRDRSVWIATSHEDILQAAESLAASAFHIQSRSQFMKRIGTAMASCRHPW